VLTALTTRLTVLAALRDIDERRVRSGPDRLIRPPAGTGMLAVGVRKNRGFSPMPRRISALTISVMFESA
jgi:hypothetical protein